MTTLQNKLDYIKSEIEEKINKNEDFIETFKFNIPELEEYPRFIIELEVSKLCEELDIFYDKDNGTYFFSNTRENLIYIKNIKKNEEESEGEELWIVRI